LESPETGLPSEEDLRLLESEVIRPGLESPRQKFKLVEQKLRELRKDIIEYKSKYPGPSALGSGGGAPEPAQEKTKKAWVIKISFHAGQLRELCNELDEVVELEVRLPRRRRILAIGRRV
jgi:hypothetical protein